MIDETKLSQDAEILLNFGPIKSLVHGCQGLILGRFNSDEKAHETGLVHLFQDIGPLGNLQAGIDHVFLFDALCDEKITNPFNPVHVGSKNIVSKGHHTRLYGFNLCHDRLRRPHGPFSLFPQGIELEITEFAIIGTTSRSQHEVYLNIRFKPFPGDHIFVSAEFSVWKKTFIGGYEHSVRVMHDGPVFSEGESGYLP